MTIPLEFLRPWWFLSLIPIFWILWRAWQLKSQQGRWQKVIDPKFQVLLLGNAQQTTQQTSVRLAIFGLGLIWLLTVVALAGPSLKTVKLPAEKVQQGSVVLLDLSLSMLADDLAPNRISRARFKLIDVLNTHPEMPIGLVGYAGTAHSIAPISEDNQTLLEMLPTLTPLIMPEYGSDPLAAMKLAHSMLQSAQIRQGHLIWVTDDVETDQANAIETWLKKHDLSLSILAVGTEAGGSVQIPDYGLLRDKNQQIITPSLPYPLFQQLSQTTGAALTPLTVDESDVSLLLPSNLGAMAKDATPNDAKEVVHKLDDGAALIILLIPLIAFAYRRGWLFSVSLIFFLPLSTLMAPPSYASESKTQLPDFAEVFETPDQQGYNAFNNQNFQAAEALFESSEWKGASLYRLEKYQEAANEFKKDPSARGHYNLGNALAKLTDFEGAKQAYEQALKLQPDFADAQANLDLIEQLLAQQNQQNDLENNSVLKSDESGKDASNQQDPSESNPPKPEKNQPEEKTPESNRQDSQGPSEPAANPPSEPNPPDESGQSSDKPPKQDDPTSQGESTDLEGNTGQERESQTSESDSAKPDDLGSSEPPSSEETPNNATDQPPAEHETGETGRQAQEDPNGPTPPDSEADTLKGMGDQADGSQPERSPTDLKEQEQTRANDNWLKQIPDQPGLFLKRKFEYQYQQQNSNNRNQSGHKALSPNSVEKIW